MMLADLHKVMLGV